ncbi:MAG: hypothetical protein CVV37_08485, partial [Nitrospira bacterium HGW-Nitrospira-1]
MKKKIIVLILLFGLITLFTNKVYCQSITITGGNITLTIETATAGQEPGPVKDESTGLIYQYVTLLLPLRYKITVKTNLPAPLYTITVEAVNLTSSGDPGDAQGEVTLLNNTVSYDLITDIEGGTLAAPQHTCTLKYTASAT